MGQNRYANFLSTALSSAHKGSASIQAEKWGTKRQLADSGKILKALIALKKEAGKRLTQLRHDIGFALAFGEYGQPVLQIGETAPQWMDRLARDALW